MSLLSPKLKESLAALDGVEVFSDVDLTKYSTMKLESWGTLIKVTSVESLTTLVKKISNEGIATRPIGWGANFVLPEKPDFVLIKIDLIFDKTIVNEKKDEFRIPGSAPLNVLTSLASKYGLSGWEVFTGVPASLGGAIAMNAGTSLGEIGEIVKSVKVINTSGEVKEISIDENSFSYRRNNFLNEGDIIIEAVLTHKGIDPSLGVLIKEYLQRRTDSQPLKEKTCGCMFKNQSVISNKKEITCRAGQYIDIMGLKGFSTGSIRISPKHANFMENRGNSGSEQVKKLVTETLQELEFHYGVKFETEVHLP